MMNLQTLVRDENAGPGEVGRLYFDAIGLSDFIGKLNRLLEQNAGNFHLFSESCGAENSADLDELTPDAGFNNCHYLTVILKEGN